MANNPITPSASSYVNGTVIDAQYMDDLAAALNRTVDFRTQAAANSTLTLVVGDAYTQELTGTTAGQIVQMPVTSTLGVGMPWIISNKSTQTIAVNSSGGNLIFTVPAATDWLFTCNAITGTTAASWSNSYAGASAAPTSVTPGMTLVKNASFSGVANTGTTFDEVFTSAYKKYLIVIADFTCTSSTSELYFNLRYAGPTTDVGAYYGNSYGYTSGSALVQYPAAGDSKLHLGKMQTSNPSNIGQLVATIGGGASLFASISGTRYDDSSNVNLSIGGGSPAARIYTGFILTPAAGNITGTILVYGLSEV